MNGGLPISGWLLLVATIVIPFSLVLTFFFAHYNDSDRKSQRVSDRDARVTKGNVASTEHRRGQ